MACNKYDDNTEMIESVVIDKRFHGPPGSANGGYSCGLIGKHIIGAAVVRLRIPPPLDTPMKLVQNDTGLQLLNGNELVATARPSEVDIEVPAPPDFMTAQAASSRYRGFESHYYPGCFVCGPDREPDDGLRVFAGPVDHSGGPEGMVAAAWIPDESLTGQSGMVRTEYLWAVLDCPGAYAFDEPATGAILLGELAVSVTGSVAAGEKCVLIGWQISHEGRKHYTGTALFGETGICRAVGHATWFEVATAP